MNDDLILLGQIGAAHGIKGEVRIKSFTEHPLDISSYGTLSTNRDGLTIEIGDARVSKSMVIAHIRGVKNRNEAEKLNGVKLFVERAFLLETMGPSDEDDFLQADLIGLKVFDAEGEDYGTIKAVQNYGGGDILEILPSIGPSVLYPFTKQAVPQVDIAKGQIIIDPPIGLFDDGDEEGEADV